ncbi:SHOCT domain-containing protein [Actinophytocola sp.]|uniref:SHOCT domain-containing protein n=1 Tax=Actinophytocola sp. TaxID=1872138 RepID=UPI002D7E8E48|nr:SHOCT domain-containing protein [Actinophytocola sp.]HET9139284.1 SHOCT domain-containing protein [Actinophytocola sp.]
MMFWYGNGMSGWGYALMTVGMVLFWGLLIVAVVVLVRYLGHTTQSGFPTGQRSTPEQILAERFARGEIDEDEYRSRIATLRGHTPVPE